MAGRIKPAGYRRFTGKGIGRCLLTCATGNRVAGIERRGVPRRRFSEGVWVVPVEQIELRGVARVAVVGKQFDYGKVIADHCEGEIADILNERGFVSGEGQAFHTLMVLRIRRAYGIKTRYDRLRDVGLLILTETADLLGVTTSTVKKWRDRGLLRAHAYNDKNECLYDHPGDAPPVKRQGQKLSKRRRFPEVAPNPAKEVQYEA